MIALYLRYLKAQGTVSREREQQIPLLLDLRARIDRARLSRQDPVCIPLTLAEWRVLKKALGGCAWMIREYTPDSSDRADLLRVLEGLREKIARIISAALN